MKGGIFKKEYSVWNEIKKLILIFIGFIITIINPISWVVYLILYKIGTVAGEDKNTIRITSQWFSFLISIFCYIILIGYLIYKGINNEVYWFIK